MQKQNIEIKFKQNIIPEFSSGTSTHAVTHETNKRQAWKTLKPVQGLSYRSTRAFTLIELLVVVLIIGILAAIALPQYQKAVLKSEYASMLTYVKTYADAYELYYLGHGVYPTKFDQMDVSLPLESAKSTCGWSGTDKGRIGNICIYIFGELKSIRVLRKQEDRGSGYEFFATGYNKLPRGIYCRQAPNNMGTQDGYCKGPVLRSDAWGTWYSLQ